MWALSQTLISKSGFEVQTTELQNTQYKKDGNEFRG